ncbi:hypothetical protein [Candidatus Amarolinea dominans]|uniref:hypothetical protein n=1 Tax=Candidatus Amarolinea dominans TaxID=3140696 RepID=UPI0031CCC1D0
MYTGYRVHHSTNAGPLRAAFAITRSYLDETRPGHVDDLGCALMNLPVAARGASSWIRASCHSGNCAG